MSMTYGIAAAVLLLLVLLVGRLVLRRDPRDHVDRFHQARSMTTKWAEEYQREQPPAGAYPGGANEAGKETDRGDQGPTVRQGRARRSVT
ncbi:MAG: hypothetical protein ACJ74O_10365 [Frankiaceae bacterium]